MLKRLLYLLLVFPLSCIEPYKVELPQGEQLLTIDGFITTDFGPHVIRLTRSDTYGSVFEGLIRPVTQANVVVRDSDGNVTFLEELLERGAYQTPSDFRAQVGKSYTLLITLQGGKSYTSLPERVSAVPELVELSYRAVGFNTEDRLLDRSGAQILAHFNDPGDQTNFYYWRTGNRDYVLVANPELYRLPDTHPTNPRGEAPKPCCAICYLKERSTLQRFAIASDEGFNGLPQRLPVAFVEDDGLRFKEAYRAEILQMSVSANAHRFLRLVEQQTSLTGSVFDSPPANIRGNMISLDDPDEPVLGYFIAAGVSKKEVYIKPENMEILQTPRTIPDDCLTIPGATLDPPANWNPDN
jgi:hypothetical protein